jgi:hypothetical protein
MKRLFPGRPSSSDVKAVECRLCYDTVSSEDVSILPHRTNKNGV